MREPISMHSARYTYLMRGAIRCNQHAISMHSARYTYLFDRAPVADQFVEGAFEVLKDHLRRPLGIPN